MAEPQASKLFVNLGASQVRRRLKGFGHGVRKIETAGNHLAVIIHTATGQHLRQLEAKFADVGFSESEPASWLGLKGVLNHEHDSTNFDPHSDADAVD